MVLLTRRGAVLGAASLPLVPAFLSRPASAAPAIGAAAPDFALPDQDGTTRRLSEFRGRVVVLEWTNHDCPYVRKHYNSTNMQNLQRDAAARNIVWLSIASSPRGEQGHVTGPEAKALTASRNAAPAAVLLDHRSQAARAYAATTTPGMYVIDAQGRLRYMGAIDSIRSTRVEDVARAEPFLRDAMVAVQEGRQIERAVTPPYGCVIKYVDA
ncbi:redoxin domain-containing protein [Roseococcus sp. SYP-B2431]|uniref:redoxin domain-containing protein n=1 Tax=Roseococcus sp. SYP-B2431 TaxID=2496640 RepID=UPI00103AC076|nr:redoxin domain-containing protein [Roseococcus sp. SYP-B2431]TCH97891.1 redoxin domain-containing protein [Roseococcus sp. SYP-B2431]